jgi:peptide/nickel transport system substrate-binding protein
MKPRSWWWIPAAALSVAACRETLRCPTDWCGTAVALTAEPNVLFPPSAGTYADRWMVDLIFSKLADVGTDLNTVGDAGFVPQLAEKWAWESPTTLRFTLDSRARWHDGRPVTAQDVAFTFDVYRDTLVNSPARPLLDRIASVTAADSHTVVFRYRVAYPEAFYDAVYHVQVLPRHLLETVPRQRLASHPFGRHPIGSGPFRFVSWTAGQSVELAGDSTYFLGRPALRRLIWRVVPDMATAVTQLAAGEADLLWLFGPPDLFHRAKAAPHVRLMPYGASAYSYIGFNLRDPAHPDRPHPLFGDRELRRAISMAVDRQALVSAVLGDLGELPSGPLTSRLWIASGSPQPLAFDTAAARRGLEAKGWRLGTGGLRTRAGRQLTFDLLVPSTSTLRQRVAVIVQYQLKRLGIGMQIIQLDFNTFISRSQAGQFDASFLSWSPDPTPRSLQQTWTSKGTGVGGSNYQHYCNPAFDHLVQQAIDQPDRARALELWHQAIATIDQDAPSIWLFAPRPALAVHRRFQDVVIRPDQWTTLLWKWRINSDSLIARDLVVAP